MSGEGPSVASGSREPKIPCESMEPTIYQLTPLEHKGKWVDLSLQIPPRPTAVSSHLSSPLPSLGSSRGSSSVRGFLQEQVFKNQTPVPNERSPLLHPDPTARLEVPELESASLANVIEALTWNRCMSLPITPALNFSPSTSVLAKEPTGNGEDPSYLVSIPLSPEKQKREKCPHEHKRRTVLAKVPRSLSAPMRNIIILRSVSFTAPKEHATVDIDRGLISPAHLEDGDEEICDEDAHCRICYEELCGRNSLKLECSCKGDLRLLHEECAVKWFGMQSKNKCDVCAQEILNLPVILFRLQSSSQNDNIRQQIHHHYNSQLTRAWQDVVLLILISTMCYFFFLEQLLVDDLKSQAIMIAAPFSFSLGLLSSLFSIVLALRDYVWAYSAFEFCLVIIFFHFIYSMIRVPAIYAILLAAFVAYGTAMSINFFVLRSCIRRAQVAQTQTTSSPV